MTRVSTAKTWRKIEPKRLLKAPKNRINIGTIKKLRLPNNVVCIRHSSLIIFFKRLIP
ncbi:MAG: hypothetical protein ACLFNK_02600 [Candidatus Woesearchaeota archaeon]